MFVILKNRNNVCMQWNLNIFCWCLGVLSYECSIVSMSNNLFFKIFFGKVRSFNRRTPVWKNLENLVQWSTKLSCMCKCIGRTIEQKDACCWHFKETRLMQIKIRLDYFFNISISQSEQHVRCTYINCSREEIKWLFVFIISPFPKNDKRWTLKITSYVIQRAWINHSEQAVYGRSPHLLM